MKSGNGWGFTVSMRLFAHQIRHFLNFKHVIYNVAQRKGCWFTIIRGASILWREGVEGIKWRLRVLDSSSARLSDRGWQNRGRGETPSPKPLVSIVTRTYGNRQGFLREAINSVLSQTYRPLQLVVVEDGATNARQLIDELVMPQGVTVNYESLPKRGRCYAGNRGLELAEGELIGFLDDDDLLLPDHVESLIKHLQSHPNAAGAYSSSLRVPTDVICLSPLEYKEGKNKLFGRKKFSINSLWNRNYIPIQSPLFKKDLFLKYGGFSEELDCLEDWDLWIRYTSENDFVFLDRVTSKFRTPKNKAMRSSRKKQLRQYLPALRRRQKELLTHHEGAFSHQRLKDAFDSIQG